MNIQRNLLHDWKPQLKGNWGWRATLAVTLLCACLSSCWLVGAQAQNSFKVTFTNVAKSAGLTHQTIYGDEHKNKYLLETTGCGVAWFDYNNDGWLDLFFVNGTRLGPLPKVAGKPAQAPVTHLYRNNRNGSFTDVTQAAGIARTGWGQGACVGDYDNDGWDDLFISYYGKNALYRNNGNGTFTDVSTQANVAGTRTRWGAGAAFVDYDKDGRLDLFVANYIELDLKTAPTPETGPCLYKGLMVACGPPGLEGGKNLLYRNEGNGTFTDVSEKAGILKTMGTYGLGVLTADFDGDAWPDIYVANDSAPATLYRNNRDGTFSDIAAEAGAAYSADGKPQAGMGVAAGDYDGDGRLDIFKTNFSGDTSTLYRNLGVKDGLLSFDDVTFASGIGLNTRWLGWGCGFLDFDNDSWLDIFLVNGHVYPEVEKLTTEAGYPQRKVLYQNLRNGNFKDITETFGGALLEPTAARGCAFGDYDNDGDVDVVINPVNDVPQLLRCDAPAPDKGGNNWLAVRAEGVKSNRSGIGATVRIAFEEAGRERVQFNEVRSGGSYYSQNDLRVHFGLGKASNVKTLEIRWPSGIVDTLKGIAANRVVTVKEGSGQVVEGKKGTT